MNKIKILHVLHSVGGVDVSLRLILENINPDYFENIVVHGKRDTKKPFVDKNSNQLKEYNFPIKREISPIKDCIAVFKTIKVILKEKPNVIHCHSSKGGIIGRAAGIFFKKTVFHTPQAYSYLSAVTPTKRSMYLAIERVFKNFNSVLLASSPSEMYRGIQEVKYKKNKVLLFNNCIAPIKIHDVNLKPAIYLPQTYICTVGRPSYQKNIEMMVEVIRGLKKAGQDCNLVITGVGEYSPNLNHVKSLIAKYGLEKNIILVEWIGREEIFKIIKKSMLYISTARYEGLPYSIIESLSLGKACVATNCDGNKDLIINGYNGYLVEKNDVNGMIDKILTLQNNKELCKKLESNAYKLYEEKYNIKKNIIELEKIYRNYST